MYHHRGGKFQPVPDVELDETQHKSRGHESEQASHSMEPLPLPPSKRSSFIRRWRHIFWTALPMTGAILWTAMMIDFYVYFITLPRSNESWPRIGFSYATFPFISCIGAVKLPSFRGFSGAVAATNSLAFVTNFYLMRKVHVGRFWRALKLATALNGSLFLVLLSIYSVDSSNSLHLIFTSIQIMSTGLTKTFDTIETYYLLKVAPQTPYINRIKWIKRLAATIASPSSVLAIVGIYGCRDALVVLNPGTTCNRLVEIAAPAEWILAGCWTLYLIGISTEMYNIDKVREELLLQIEKRQFLGTSEAQFLLDPK